MGKRNKVELEKKKEERLRKRREAAKKRNFIRNLDPVKREEYLEKRRLAYKCKKQVNLENQVEIRERWKKSSRIYREKRKIQSNEINDCGDINKANSLKRRAVAVQRRIEKMLKQHLTVIQQKNEEIDKIEKICEMYKKMYQRAVLSAKTKKEKSVTPKSTANVPIKTENEEYVLGT